MGVRLHVVLLLCGLTLGLAQKDIRRPPDILPSGLPVHIMYEDDIDVVLPCQATGFPFPTYEWVVDGQILDPNSRNIAMSPDPRDGTLTIGPITSMDEGYYQCRARSVHGTSVSSVYHLQRARFGRFPVTDVRNYTVKAGEPLKLECQDVLSVPKASFSWALVKTTIDQNPVSLVTNRRVTRDSNGNLYFSHTNRGDAQLTTEDPELPSLLYKCNVFNSHLDLTIGGSYSRIIVEPPEETLSDKAPSLLHATQSPYLAIKGEEIKIQCIFAGRPGVEVTWEPMPGGRSSTEEHGTILVITDVEFSDEGLYKCRGRNNAGEMHESIMVDVQSKPEFEAQPLNMNATEEDTVSVECRVLKDTEPPASIEWFINGEPIDFSNPGPRTEVSDGGKRLTISRLCKDCYGGSSDLKVIQCNASNVHGYVFSDGYLNVLLKTVILAPPEDQYLDVDDGFAVFRCEADSDASTPVIVNWEFEDKPLDFYADERYIRNGSSLIINLDGLDMDDKRRYEGTYSCFATNTYSSQGSIAKLYIDDGIVEPLPWWVWLILALLFLILLLLLLLLCCCCCYRRNRGGVYPVDEKERAMGNDPEKECEVTGFHDYRRPEEAPLKGSRASLSSTVQLDLDEEGSLAEYGLYDTQHRMR